MTDPKNLEHLYNAHLHNVSDKWSSYLPAYDTVFSPYKDRPVNLLEIGVQNGGSLEIWAKYFHKSNRIIGFDINPKCEAIIFENSGINLIVGDINNEDALEELKAISTSLDIIIDDGSHLSSDIIKTFCKTFPLLNLGGVYVIEDLHCSYWKQFEGGLSAEHSSVEFFKRLVDVLNFEHWGLESSRRSYLKDFDIPETLSEGELACLHSIVFINSMCIIKKNAEGANLLGKRKVVGQVETVSLVRQVDNTSNETPPQTQSNRTLAETSRKPEVEALQRRIRLLENELLASRKKDSSADET